MSELRQKTFDFYSDQVPLLEVQCKVEEFKARIAVIKFTAVEHKVKYMQLTHELNQAENKDAKAKVINKNLKMPLIDIIKYQINVIVF